MGRGVTEAAKATVEKLGGGNSFCGVEPKDVDFSPALTKIIKTENPRRHPLLHEFPTSAGLIVKQTRQLGFGKPIIGCDGFLDPGMIKAAGAAANHVSKNEALYFTFQAPPYAGAEAPAPVRHTGSTNTETWSARRCTSTRSRREGFKLIEQFRE
jgi:ABC-type branched-subunit amino acid transport system substrate-binding protein